MSRHLNIGSWQFIWWAGEWHLSFWKRPKNGLGRIYAGWMHLGPVEVRRFK